MKSRKSISPKQLASALGVSESSIKRWCDQGSLVATRTPGGHRRIPVDTAVAFARKTGRPIARPELLGLMTSKRSGSYAEIVPLFTRDLLAGNEPSIREMTYELFLRKTSLADVFEKVMRPAIFTMMMGRDDGSVKEFERRRGQSILSSVLDELRSEIPPVVDGPVACGANRFNTTLGLCSQMVELVLRSQGWSAFRLGASCPVDVLIEAGREMKPNLVWYIAAEDEDPESTRQDCNVLITETSRANIPLFLGIELADHAPPGHSHVRGSRSITEFVEFLDEIHKPRTADQLSHG